MLAASVQSQSNCLSITSWNRFGNKPDGSCFEVSISDLYQMIIHTQVNIIGFTFNFKNGSSQSYSVNSGIMNKSVIDLNNIYMTKASIYVGDGIEGLKFELYDSTTQNLNSTEIIGNSQKGCFSYLNSSFFKAESLVIDSIKGCFDNNQLNYFPFLEFSYSFSECSVQVKHPMKTVSSTTMMSSTKSITLSSFFNPFVFNSTISSTITSSLTSLAISQSYTFTSPTSTIALSSTTSSTLSSTTTYSSTTSSTSTSSKTLSTSTSATTIRTSIRYLSCNYLSF
jgi:hypothetical protein